MSKQRVKGSHQASSQGTSVLKVEAVDGDKGINDIMTYSITSKNQGVPQREGWGKGGVVRSPGAAAASASLLDSTRSGWFSIEEDGVIEVSGPLDREQLLNDNEEVQIQVTVSTAPLC